MSLPEDMQARLAESARQRSSTAAACRAIGIAIMIAIVLALVTGCTRPKQFTAPSPKVLNEHIERARASAEISHDKAKESVQVIGKARKHHAEATISHSKEQVIVGELKPAIESLKVKITDPQLREEVDALAEQIAELAFLAAQTDAAQVLVTKNLDAGLVLGGEAVVGAADAVKTLEGVETKHGPSYQKAVENTIHEANIEVLEQAAQTAREEKAKWFWFTAFSALVIFLAAKWYLGRKAKLLP